MIQQGGIKSQGLMNTNWEGKDSSTDIIRVPL